MKGPAPYSFSDGFEEPYIRLRAKEGRIFNDSAVINLPYVDKANPNYKEWKIRAHSFKKIMAHIKHKGTGLDMLEVGCGNGWLSAQLAAATTGTVIGTDINNTELEQARRVFYQRPNLSFVNCDIRDHVPGDQKFDIIVFAASIQYFSSLKEILDVALENLSEQGEIHILDSHFYQASEIEAARQRTKDYYASMAFDVLTNYYYHHSIEELNGYQYKLLQNPYSWKNKLSAVKNPFHWIVLKKQALEK